MIIGRTKAHLISDITIDQDIPMVSHKLTGLGNGSENDHSANIAQILTAIAAEETARNEAIGAHSDLDTGVHGVGASTVCSKAEAAAIAAGLISTHAEDADAHHTKLLATSGSYAGDSTENRAIAHGLGAIPKIVFIHNATNRVEAWTIVGVAEYNLFNVTTEYPVTAPDDTNFYVGDSLSGSKYGNETGRTYYWVALG